MSDFSDPTDRAAMESERDLQRALTRHRNRAPERALRGTDCRDCGDAIGAKRLAAHPDASRCIHCARAYEQRARHIKVHG